MSGFGHSKSPRSSSSSVSPFRSRRTPKVSGGRPTTPSSSRSSNPPPPALSSNASSPSTPTASERADFSRLKESVTVTVRFRPLSAREINRGDEIAWYADGDYTVRNEYNASIAYGFDRVFGPATTTRHVYDVAAQHVVRGAMEGINGTVFAYGVTSSGKTHTMHGEQKSPGIIPLAVKDVFGIIQETPGREFLLRVSYLEIYNEVINDLLDPAGQNLRIREDSQGTYVEGIKEEVVLSPAHALSLIASGEELRHVGSNNFNLLSSRSHTIFTLTVESSPCGENEGDEDVTLSQLNLIDLAGSESSKTETTGLRRKEGSYINKSLLTLGTVIAKLTDGKATHVPYRDSKLTRLLQSSLSGHGRISLICTVTPASSNSEETHNTLKFAHRSKHVEIKASQNKIIDEKSLIKKYQREISTLKQELQQLKRGIIEKPYFAASNQDDLFNLKLQLEAGQVKLQSRLEEEEQEKAALMGRIQRLTKLILVSSKNSLYSSTPMKAGYRRRHSFGEDELAYLPDRKHEYMIDDDIVSLDPELSDSISDAIHLDDPTKEDKKNRRRGMLSWFKLRKPEHLIVRSSNAESETSTIGSPTSSSQSSQLKNQATGNERKKPLIRRSDGAPTVDSFPGRTQAGDLFSATVRGRLLPPTESTITDQMDLLREQVKMLAGEIALCSSTLKRFSEQAVKNPDDLHLQENAQKLRDEIIEKQRQMFLLEQRMIGSVEATPNTSNSIDMAQAMSKLTTQLDEVTFELEIKSADNRVLQEQLQTKISENAEMQETILLLREKLSSLTDEGSNHQKKAEDGDEDMHRNCSIEAARDNGGFVVGHGFSGVSHVEENMTTNMLRSSGIFSQDSYQGCNADAFVNSKVLEQAAEIENLKQEMVILMEEKDGLEMRTQKLAEEASYAKELAAAAAVELRNLAEEVTKLSYQNEKLTSDLAAAKELVRCRSSCHRQDFSDGKPVALRKADELLIAELQGELTKSSQREASLEAALSDKNQIECGLQRRIAEAKQREEALEDELANMWVLVAKLKKNGLISDNTFDENENNFNSSQKQHGFLSSIDDADKVLEHHISDENAGDLSALAEVKANYDCEKRRCRELERTISRIKGEDVGGLDVNALEELQSFHVEAITKICQAKCTIDTL